MREGALGLVGLALLGPLSLFARDLRGEPVVPEPAGPLPNESRYLGHPVPDLRVRRAGAAEFALSELWREKPLLLALVFARCAGVCSPSLGSLRSAEAAVGGSGKDYRTLVLSFDLRDRESDLAAMARGLGLEGRSEEWIFGVAADDDVKRLARAVGFWFRWDERTRQFDHPALLVAIDRGRVVRLLVGGTVEPVRLQEVVRELRGEFVSAYPLPRKVLFRCFQYDPRRGRFVLDTGFLLLALPGALTLLGTIGLFAAAGRRRASAS